MLFHGTGIYPLAAIVASDSLLEGVHWGRPGEPHGPRLASDVLTASKFILYSMHWAEGGLVVVDEERLRRDYNLVSYRDTDCTGEHWKDEVGEVVVETPAVVGLSQYLVSIVCDPRVIEEAMKLENMEGAVAECGWAFEDESEIGILQAKHALERLAAHPKLNAWVPGTGFPLHGNWFSAVEPPDLTCEP